MQPRFFLLLPLILVAGVLVGCGVKAEDDAVPAAPDPVIHIMAGSVDAGPGASPASCQTTGAGLSNCGDGGASCCTSLEVPGGTYFRTYTNVGDGGTGEADPATISTFRLDEYDVTVGRFRQFVNAVKPNSDGGAPLGWTPPNGSGKHTYLNAGLGLLNSSSELVDGGALTYEEGWVAKHDNYIAPTNANLACSTEFSTWTDTAGSQENLPINCANWWEAYAFCIWDGGFLPSEAEWEYAAAGGNKQREYPWNTKSPGTACPGTGCEYAIYKCEYPSGSGICTGVTNIAPVGAATLGAGKWGQLDLEGSMLQWNLDYYNATYVDPCTNCAFLTEGSSSDRVSRGADFKESKSDLSPTLRGSFSATGRDYGHGFRCARAPLVPCTTSGQTGCVECQGNSNGVCTPTEALFVQQDITADIATAPGPDPSGGCYSCLLGNDCIDDSHGDTGNECGDATSITTGTSSECISTVSCVLSSACAAQSVSICYCGTAPTTTTCNSDPSAENGSCASAIAAGSGFAQADGPDILENLTNTAEASGMAMQIFECGHKCADVCQK